VLRASLVELECRVGTAIAKSDYGRDLFDLTLGDGFQVQQAAPLSDAGPD
jgi:hypothetical protein